MVNKSDSECSCTPELSHSILMLLSCASNEVINHLATIDEMAQQTPTMIPMQVLADIDSSRNPMQLTRERLERAAAENQFMNGKIAAIDVGTILFMIFALADSFRSPINNT